MVTKNVAWFGEESLKTATMARLREDRRLDRIVQKQYWGEGRGCHLGCLTRLSSDTQSATERLFGIPIKIAHLLEAVFEGLPSDKCEWWVIEGTDAIPVGADLSLASHELAYWLLGPESPSAKGNSHNLVADAIMQVRELHRRAAVGEAVDFSAARSAAWSAESAADLAAWSAAESAMSAASAARSAARSDSWKSIADKCIEIFRACPVIQDAKCEPCVQATMLYLSSPVKDFSLAK